MPENPQEHNGWWLASDGQWYPPEPTPVPPRRNFVARHKILTISLAIVTALVVLGAVSPKKTPVKLAQPVVTRPKAPVTTVPPTTEPATTIAPPTSTAPITVPPPPPTTAAPRPTVAPPTTTAPTLPPPVDVVAAYKAQTQRVTVSQLVNNPANYDGIPVVFTANVDNFLQNSAGWTTAMNVSDPADPTSTVYVQLSGFAETTNMGKGDVLTIWGDGTGTASTKNAFGGSINVSTVTEVYMVDATTGYVDYGDRNPR